MRRFFNERNGTVNRIIEDVYHVHDNSINK
jgi:hypothetical protein